MLLFALAYTIHNHHSTYLGRRRYDALLVVVDSHSLRGVVHGYGRPFRHCHDLERGILRLDLCDYFFWKYRCTIVLLKHSDTRTLGHSHTRTACGQMRYPTFKFHRLPLQVRVLSANNTCFLLMQGIVIHTDSVRTVSVQATDL